MSFLLRARGRQGLPNLSSLADPEAGSTNHCSPMAPVTVVLPDISPAPHPIGLRYHSVVRTMSPCASSHGIDGMFAPRTCPLGSWAGQPFTPRMPTVSNTDMATWQHWSWLLNQVFWGKHQGCSPVLAVLQHTSIRP